MAPQLGSFHIVGRTVPQVLQAAAYNGTARGPLKLQKGYLASLLGFYLLGDRTSSSARCLEPSAYF